MLQLSKYTNTILLYNKKSFFLQSFGLMSSKVSQVNNKDVDDKKFTPIFRTSHLNFFVGLNRFKKVQTLALSCLIPTCFGLNILGQLTLEEVICASLLGSGLTAGLHIGSWFFSNNLVVFVYLSENETECRMSYISYWGSREELYCNIEDVEVIQSSKLSFLNYKIRVKDNKNTLKLISRNATIFNNAKCRKVFSNDVI